MRGTVQAINPKTVNTVNGPRTVYNIVIDGQQYGLGFSLQALNGAQVGSPVEFTATPNPKNPAYFNIQTLQPLAGGTGVSPHVPNGSAGPAFPTTPAPAPAHSASSTQEQIVRQTCIRVALDMVNARLNHPVAKKVVSLDDYFSKTIAYADQFFKYVTTGKVAESGGDAAKLTESGVTTESTDEEVPF